MPNGFGETSSQASTSVAHLSSIRSSLSGGGRHNSSSLTHEYPSTVLDDDDLPDDEQATSEAPKSIKTIRKQRGCRALVTFGAMSTFALGVIATVMGFSVSSAAWLSSCLGRHSDSVSSSSLVLGSLVLIFSLLGCVGAANRKKPCLCAFGLVVTVLLIICSGGLSVLTETETALQRWSEQEYRLYASTAAGSNLTSAAEELLHTLYIELSAVYAFCAPNATGVGAVIAALDSHVAPAAGVLHCRQTDSLAFAEWVNLECLAPIVAGNASASLLGEIGACRADLAAAQAAGDFEAQVGSEVGDTAWLFCACGRALKMTLEAEWVGPVRLVLAALAAYCALLVGLLYGACVGATKAKKRLKKYEIEMEILRQRGEAA